MSVGQCGIEPKIVTLPRNIVLLNIGMNVKQSPTPMETRKGLPLKNRKDTKVLTLGRTELICERLIWFTLGGPEHVWVLRGDKRCHLGVWRVGAWELMRQFLATLSITSRECRAA
jgi:hypothetical protein